MGVFTKIFQNEIDFIQKKYKEWDTKLKFLYRN